MKKLFFIISILVSVWYLGCSCCTVAKDDNLNVEVSNIHSYVNLMPKTDNKSRFDFYLLADLNIAYNGISNIDSLKADVETLQIGDSNITDCKITLAEIKKIENSRSEVQNINAKLKISARLMKTTEATEKLNSVIKLELGGLTAKVKLSDIEVQKVH